jgi:hypothetical protein
MGCNSTPGYTNSFPAGGIKAVEVRKQDFDEMALVKPKDLFWPIDRYRKRYGSPNSAKNRRLKHKVTTVKGYKSAGRYPPTLFPPHSHSTHHSAQRIDLNGSVRTVSDTKHSQILQAWP